MTDEPKDKQNDQPESVDDNMADLQRRVNRMQHFGWSDYSTRIRQAIPRGNSQNWKLARRLNR